MQLTKPHRLRLGNLRALAQLVRVLLLGSLVCLQPGCQQRSSLLPTADVSENSHGLICREPVWDLGEVQVKGGAATFNHTFVVENRSDEVQTLRDVRSDCGCLVASDYRRTIPPGETSEIQVAITVFGAPGPFRKSLSVSTESHRNAPIELSVTGSRAMSGLLSVSPANLQLGSVTRGTPKTRSLFVTRHNGAAVGFQSLTADTPSLQLDGSPVLSTRTSPTGKVIDCTELRVKLDPDQLPMGPFHGKLKIQTTSDDPELATLEVPVEAVITERASSLVRSLFVERLEPSQSVEQRLAEKPLESPIRSVEFRGSDALEIELIAASGEARSPIPAIRIRRNPESQQSGLIRGELLLTWEDPTQDAVTIRVTAYLPM